MTDPSKYKAKQLLAEAEDLLPKKCDAKSDEDQEIDSESRMRKVPLLILQSRRYDLDLILFLSQLLRRSSDLMLVTTLPDDLDECPICYNKLELKNCSA